MPLALTIESKVNFVDLLSKVILVKRERKASENWRVKATCLLGRLCDIN
jgi:hypothetical protein